MDIVTKDFPVTAGEPTEQYPNGSFEVILSAPTKDRDGEVIDTRAFDPLPDHITFDTDHSMTCDSVVGSGVPSYAADGTLRVTGGYAADERSQIIRQKVADGHIRTTSVTFMAAEREEKDGVPHVIKAELLNGTFTPIPSNREAVVLSAKSILAHAVAAKAGARNSAKDAEVIQGMHDSAVALGAGCEAKSSPRGAAETKSVVGSLEATQDRVRDALNDAYGSDAYVWLRATLPDTVVYEVQPVDGGSECETYQESYTDDGSVVTLGGDAKLVDLNEVVVPDPDAETADQATSSPAADAARADAAKSADEGSDRLAAYAESKAAALALIEDIA